MAIKVTRFTCYHSDCVADPPTELTLRGPGEETNAGGLEKKKVVYCDRGHANMIRIPATWDVVLVVLGDQAVLDDAESDLLRGEQPSDDATTGRDATG